MEHHHHGGEPTDSLEHRLLRAILHTLERQEEILRKIEKELEPKLLQSSGATVKTIA
jgi:hypothetical protein